MEILIKNKLIGFTYYLKLFFTLNHAIKLFCQNIKTFKLLSWFTKYPLTQNKCFSFFNYYTKIVYKNKSN